MENPVLEKSDQSTPIKLTQKDLHKYSSELLKVLKHAAHHGTMGNVTLQKQLNWTDEVYWKVRNSLIADGKLERGKGKGGSVRLIRTVEQPSIDSTGKPLGPVLTHEIEYYSLLREGLDGWAKDQGYEADQYGIEITGLQGSKDTGGIWTRPDISLAACRTYKFIPGRHQELITFEVKLTHEADRKGVYEALAHRKACHRSYLVLCGPHDNENCKDGMDSLKEEANRVGIGLIHAIEAGNFTTWETIVDAETVQPELQHLNDFILKILPEDLQEKILKWVKA